MITEIVIFKLPEGTTREEVIANYEKTAPTWRDDPTVMEKPSTNAERWPYQGTHGGDYILE
jgi:hypothetical protein